MCAIGVTFSTLSSAQPLPAPAKVPTHEATTGETITKAAPPSAPPTSKAKPSVTGPAPLPPEEEGLPG
jgi:hypothetical protein